MNKVKITAIKKIHHLSLSQAYENPLDNPCSINENDVFICENATMPQGFCPSAWHSIFPFVLSLACGGGDFYNGWMKNPKSAMISCNDGFRPVSFLLELI